MRGPYDTPKRSHVIKTRLDDDEYEFFLRKCQVYGSRDQILAGEQGAFIKSR